MPRFDALSDFVKSGARRLRDAEELLQPPTLYANESGSKERHLRGAMYLAGYAVECMLKAYLISLNPPCRRLSEVVVALRRRNPDLKDICSSAGHDLPYLVSLTGLEARMDALRKRQMSVCSKWSSSWRYDPNSIGRDHAEEFVKSARELSLWIQSQI